MVVMIRVVDEGLECLGERNVLQFLVHSFFVVSRGWQVRDSIDLLSS